MRLPTRFWPFVLLMGVTHALLAFGLLTLVDRLASGNWPPAPERLFVGCLVAGMFFGYWMWRFRARRQKFRPRRAEPLR